MAQVFIFLVLHPVALTGACGTALTVAGKRLRGLHWRLWSPSPSHPSRPSPRPFPHSPPLVNAHARLQAARQRRRPRAAPCLAQITGLAAASSPTPPTLRLQQPWRKRQLLLPSAHRPPAPSRAPPWHLLGAKSPTPSSLQPWSRPWQQPPRHSGHLPRPRPRPPLLRVLWPPNGPPPHRPASAGPRRNGPPRRRQFLHPPPAQSGTLPLRQRQ
jgi:hypothetical protein